MSVTTPQTAVVTTDTSSRKRRGGLPGLRGTGTVGHIAAAVILIAALVAIFGRWLAPHDPDQQSLSDAFFGSSSDHLLGLDSQGRDIFSRLLTGAQASLVGPLIVVVLSIVIGCVLAIISAWRGGFVDSAISSVLDILFAFPGILLAVLVAAVFGPSLNTAAFALAIAYTPYIARVVRAAALRERSQPYIAALTVQGHPSMAICLRHLVPNVLPMIVVQATIVFGYAMVDLAAISFIGLGMQPPGTDWGLMVSGGQTGVLQGYVTEAFAAGLCIVVVVVAFNLLGERLADRSQEQR